MVRKNDTLYGIGRGASMARLGLSESHLAKLCTHAQSQYPNEACGVVLRLSDGTTQVRPMRNIQDELHAKLPEHYTRTARTAYVWDKNEREEMEALRERPGHSLVAVYHSHPDHGAYFSDTDQAAATPFGEPTYAEAAQIVVSVLDGKAVEIKTFVWSPEAATYVESAPDGSS